MKRFFILALLLCVALHFSAFAGGQAEKTEGGAAGPVKLDWWVGSWITQEHADERQAMDFEKVFEKEYPEVDIVVVPIAWEGMHDKFLLAATTNTLPHIMTSEDFLGWTAEFAATGNLKDLTDFITNDIGKDKWRTEKVLENASYKGKIFALPYRNSTRTLVWNKGMFSDAGLDPQTPPKTWSDVVAFGKKITKGERYGFSYPLKRFCTVAPEYVRSIMDAYGGDITNKAITKSTISTPETTKAVQFATDMVTKDKIVPMDIINNDDNNDFIMFSSEITAMCMVGPWTVQTFAIQNPDLNYGVATIPSKDPGKPGRFGLISMGWLVSNEVTDAEWEGVAKFLKMQMRPEVNVWFTDSLPVTTTVPAEGKNPITGKTINYADHPRYSVFLEQLKHTYPSALLHPAGPKIAREVNMAFQRIILGQDIDAVLGEADAVINELLSQ